MYILLTKLKTVLYVSVLWFLIALPVISCGDDNLVELDIGNAKADMEFLRALDENKISYSMANNKVMVNKRDAEKVVIILSNVLNEILPEGRHISFDPVNQKIILKRFEDEGIQYRLIHMNNSDWVVWEEKDTAKVEQIKYDVILSNQKK